MNIADFRISIPSKCFLIGEYAVLEGHDALILTNTPAFNFTFLKKNAASCLFHKESVAGKTWSYYQDELKDYQIIASDPYKGLGGGGLSSAEFLAVFGAVCFLKNGSKSIWVSEIQEVFKEFTKSDTLQRPSGADVVAQSLGGLVHFKPNDIPCKVSWSLNQVELILLHTKRHCKTANHLKQLKEIPENLIDASNIAIEAFLSADFSKFVNAIDSFVLAQYAAGLLADSSLAYINKYKKIDGVFAVKGCGAMGEDVLAIFCHPDAVHKVYQQALIDDLIVLSSSIKGASGFEIYRFKKQLVGSDFEFFA